jgi:hypothetical protein
MATSKKTKGKDDGWVRTKVGRKVHVDTPPKTNANRNLGVPLCAAVKANGFIFCSGAVAFDPEKGGIQHGTMESETRVTLQNLKRILEANGSSIDRIVKEIGPALKNSDKVAQVRLGRELAEQFRARYLAIAAEYGGR